MKTISWITTLLIAFYIAPASAQDHQKWYADDIYYDVSEKEINYFEITFTSYTEIESEESPRESFENRMSYSTRINRFHRNYYGSSLSFNYGYFHEPFHNDLWGYHSYRYDPFYDYGWSSIHYGWNAPYSNYRWHSAWHYPIAYHNAYHYWQDPYYHGYPFYGHHKNEHTTKKIHYGPREGLSSNVPSNSKPSYTTRTSNSSRLSHQSHLRNSEMRMSQQSDGYRYDSSKSHSTSNTRPNRTNYSSQVKSKTSKNMSEWLKNEIRINTDSQESNSGNTPAYRPLRSSKSSTTGNSRTNRPSSNTRKPR